MNSGQIIIFLTLVMIIPVYLGMHNWRQQVRRQRAAAQRGWRYIHQGWKALFKSHYVIAGTTPTGAIWEINRFQRQQYYFFRWATNDAPLPYGRMLIRPRHQGVKHVQNNLRTVQIGSQAWRDAYLLQATHDQLGHRFLTKEAEVSLLRWPIWPQPGALEEVVWQGSRLEIVGRFYDDWATLDRIVHLGTALTGRAGIRG